MLNQCVSMNNDEREIEPSLALVPVAPEPDTWTVEPSLRDRLRALAAAFGHSPPSVIPGAAALVLPLTLPLNAPRKRAAVLPFAFEPHLATPIDDTVTAIGPQLDETTWLCAAIDRDVLCDLLDTQTPTGAVIPDILAVPVPTRDGTWSVWAGTQAVHVRTGDGGGVSLPHSAFLTAWQLHQRPAIELCHGTLPGQIDTVQPHPAQELKDPDILRLNLYEPKPRQQQRAWRMAAKTTALAAAGIGLSLLGLLVLDARALHTMATERAAVLDRRLQQLDPALALDMPLRVTAARLTSVSTPLQPDAFLMLLTKIATALVGQDTVSFENLQFDATANTLSMRVIAPDIESLQRAEAALSGSKINIQSGATTQNTTGAEMMMVVTGGQDA